MKGLICFVIIVFLVGCASEQKPAPPTPAEFQAMAGPFPEDYELRIISWLRMSATNPDDVQILSIGQPQPRTLAVSAPDRGLMKGDAVWESGVVVQYKNPPMPPAYRHFYFKDGVIRAVDLK
jgi:hypothetical protein